MLLRVELLLPPLLLVLLVQVLASLPPSSLTSSQLRTSQGPRHTQRQCPRKGELLRVELLLPPPLCEP